MCKMVSNEVGAEIVKIVLGLDEVETVKETGEVVCCFNCAGYDQEDGFCNYHERYKDEQAKCKHFEPYNG